MADNIMDQMGRSWLEIDLDALRHNAAILSSLLPEGCQLMPAVKADAYGHGAVPVSRALNEAGVRAFCVATVEEGVQLRRAGIAGEILVLGYTHPQQFPLLSRYQLTQTLLDWQYAQCLSAWGTAVRTHAAIDTGMHRIGVAWNQMDTVLRLFSLPNLSICGVFTHLCADDTLLPEDRAFTKQQADRFRAVQQRILEAGYGPKFHLLGSYGLLNYPQYGGDFARVGIALFGVLNTPEPALQPVLSWKARVASVRPVRRGEPVGYGLADRSDKDTVVATLAVGYADGFPRALSCGNGAVLLHGQKARVLGRVCMDQTMVDVGGIPEVCPGDAAVLLGEDGPERLTAWEVAEAADTIPNELLSRLGSRLGRRWLNRAPVPYRARYRAVQSAAGDMAPVGNR